MQIQCLKNIIVLNINSIRNKFDALFFIIDTNIGLLLVSQTKLDDDSFRFKGFCTPYRLDSNSGLLLYFLEEIPS